MQDSQAILYDLIIVLLESTALHITFSNPQSDNANGGGVITMLELYTDTFRDPGVISSSTPELKRSYYQGTH